MQEECWNLGYEFVKWLNEHLKIYVEDKPKIVDLEYFKFDYKGKNYILVRQNTQVSAIPMVAGISCMAIGSVFFFAAGFVEAMVRFVIGGWILLSGIVRFANAMQIDKKNNPKFFSLLIISLLLILAGLYTILEANLAFQTIGIVLMIYAGLEIFGWLTNKSVVKETMTKEEKKKKRSKNKDVVDAIIIKDDTDEKKNSKK